jgi:putative ABC transport system permease protein
VGLVLVIACVNVANMTLARSAVRGRELAVRTAMGAGRIRLVRQLLAESVFLSVVGGLLGVGLAYVSLEAFVATWPTMLPRLREVGVNGPVLLFSAGVSLAAGVFFGLAPPLGIAGSNLNHTLRQGTRSVAGSISRRWMRATLVVAEVGLAVMLLIGSGLLIRSFSALQNEDPGFRTEDRLVFTTPLPRARYGTVEGVVAYGDDALARLAAVPGVESVALASLVPIMGSDEIWGIWLEGRPYSGPQDDISALFYRASPGYFSTMGIPLLAGRDITPQDREGSTRVVVVSETFAGDHFPGEDPLGRRIRFGTDDDDPWWEVVGVVGEVQHYNLGSTSMAQVYVPFAQHPTGRVSFVVKTQVPPLDLVSGIRGAIGAVDADLPLVGVRSVEDMVSANISMPRFRTLLMTGFGLTALLLAVVGLYGVLAYSVSMRSREIGIRMAMGAQRASVLGLVFREGLPLVALGSALGLGGAFALSRILESMLFGVGVRDPGVFASVPLLLVVVATAAMLVPARRAARTDPVRTLAEE